MSGFSTDEMLKQKSLNERVYYQKDKEAVSASKSSEPFDPWKPYKEITGNTSNGTSSSGSSSNYKPSSAGMPSNVGSNNTPGTSNYKPSSAGMPSNVGSNNTSGTSNYKPSSAGMPSNVPSAQQKSNTSGSSQGGTKTASKVTSSSSSSKSTSSKSSGSNKKSGVNKKVAKQAYQNVQKDLQDLEKYMNKLVDDVQKMNELYWHGDKLANTWYSTMSGHYSQNKNLNLVKFYKGVANFQTSLKTVFQKANVNKISF